MLREKILKKLTEVSEEEKRLLQADNLEKSRHTEVQTRLFSHNYLTPEKLITVRPHPRFCYTDEHTHDFVEICYMVQGVTTHVVNDTVVTLHPGELLMMGQQTRQQIHPAGLEDLAVNFIIRPEFFQVPLPYLGNEETPLRRFLVDCLCGGEGSDFLYFRVSEIEPIQHLLENLIWNMFTETPNRQEINQLTFSLLFVLLTNHTECLWYTSEEQEAAFQVLQYVEGNYRSGSLQELAQRLHYLPSSLSRKIKQATGKSYTQLVQEKRLEQAAWLLRNTKRSVAEIAHDVGYENLGYFHRLFVERFSLSPKRYRDRK